MEITVDLAETPRVLECHGLRGARILGLLVRSIQINAELNGAVLAGGSTLLEVHGIGLAGAARILADVGDVARFADRNRFASWTGTAPLDASSAEQIRHRLSRAGNRRLNHVLHIAAIVQLRNDTEGRVYYRRKLAAGKTPLEALRCLKRRLSDVIFRRLVADAREREVSGQGTGPGGHRGATQQSSAVDLPPPIDTSDQPLPGPAEPTLRPTPHPRNPDSDRTLEPIP
jgi:transposase